MPKIQDVVSSAVSPASLAPLIMISAGPVQPKMAATRPAVNGAIPMWCRRSRRPDLNPGPRSIRERFVEIFGGVDWLVVPAVGLLMGHLDDGRIRSETDRMIWIIET